MSDEKPMEPTSADELAKTKKPADIQLSEEDLNEVSGGIMKVVDKTTPL
jgi:bacteriocin-like protein